MKKDIIIIGGGASSLFCALHLKDTNICIIDPHPLGKKLLVTGNGKCNLTNTNCKTFISAYNIDISKFLEVFDHNDTIDTLHRLGLLVYEDDQGRIYPITNSAVSVQDTLVRAISNKVEYIRAKATKVTPLSGGYRVHYDDTFVDAKYCIVACGGNAQIDLPNVDIQPFTRGLCGLTTTQNHGLNGVRVSPVKVTLTSKPYSEMGEVLFKEHGISGIVIMNMSNFIQDTASLELDLLPQYSQEYLLEHITSTIKNNELLSSEILNGILIKSLAANILSKAKIDFNTSASTLNIEEIKKIVGFIKHYPIQVIGKESNNQIHLGGVPLKDLTSELEHKNNRNLYITGEYTQVKGQCGGYNLQWAFTSGTIVAKSINKRRKNETN